MVESFESNSLVLKASDYHQISIIDLPTVVL